MKVLLTGSNGYIGKRLLPFLLEEGHEVICCLRDKRRLDTFTKYKDKVQLFEVDFLNPIDTNKAPFDFDVAFYLIHSLAGSRKKFEEREKTAATNFVNYLNKTSAKQIIYLTGIVNEKNLSRHLASRKNVELVLRSSSVPVTVLRAAIIVGSGSASFEIIRDLVEKLPIMIAPKWLNTKAQPIAIRDVIKYMSGVMLKKDYLNESFDIGGSDILTYKDMLYQYAEVRKLKRIIITIPVLTPKLSSYWLYFITSTSYNIAVNLVSSMRVEVICKDNKLEQMLRVKPLSYKLSVHHAFKKIEENMVVSSWKDSFISSSAQYKMLDLIQVPSNGVLRETREIELKKNIEEVKNKIWSIGGDNGWYYADFLWKIRGAIDKLVGGTGLRRGRTNTDRINNGDALDFWRVIVSDRSNGRLLLYSEMKVPGDAWLEWKIIEKNGKHILLQTATFRPWGVGGRLYWYLMFPAHLFIFDGMAHAIAEKKQT